MHSPGLSTGSRGRFWLGQACQARSVEDAGWRQCRCAPGGMGWSAFSLLIGVFVAALVRFVPVQMLESPVAVHVIQLLIVFSSVNICLAIFNLFPLYPLDGYQILYTLLPGKQAVQFARSAAYGPLIILGLFFLLPFLAQLASPGLSTFPLFQLPYYIWLGSVNIIALVMGQIPDVVSILYTLR